MTKSAKFLLAAIAIVIVVSSVYCAFAENKTISPTSGKLINLPLKINIIAIFAPTANPQNSDPVSVYFNVSSPLVRGICGLSASNFRLATLKAPSHAPSLAITGLSQWSDPHVANNCGNNMSIAPTAILGMKPKWVSGTYNARLDYVVGGQVKTNKTFSFTIPLHLLH